MNRFAQIILVLLVCASTGVYAKSKKVNGAYVFDNKAALKLLDDKIKAMPKEQQGLAEMLRLIVKEIKYELVFKKGGKLTAIVEMPDLTGDGQKTKQSVEGSWKQKGSKVTMVVKNGEGETETRSCSFKKGKIICAQEKDMPMVFVKKK